MRHQPEVADADEARWQYMEQKPAQEFINGQRHEALFVFVSRVAPAEGDNAVGKSDEPMVRDRHPVGVLAEIAKCVFRSAEWAFRVNDPRRAEQRAKPRCKSFRILQHGEASVEAEPALRMELFEAVHKLAPEHLFENVDWQEELLVRMDPLRMVWCQTACGNDTMDVRMMLEFLIPGVKDAEESDLRAEVLRIAGDFDQRLGAGPQ